MIERHIDKTIRGRSMVFIEERIKYAEQAGYKLIGNVVETMNGDYHALMRKTIYWEERK